MSLVPAGLLTTGLAAPAAVRTLGSAAGAFSRQLIQALRSDSTAGKSPPAASSIAAASEPHADVRGRQIELQSQLALALKRILADEGIPLDAPLALQLNGFDQLEIAGEHARRGEINQVLALHPELADAFRTIESLARARSASPPGIAMGPAGPAALAPIPSHAGKVFELLVGGETVQGRFVESVA